MGQSGENGRGLCAEAEWVWGRGLFFTLLPHEVLVSLQKRLTLILCSVGDLEAFKVFVVYKLYPKFSFVTVGAVVPHQGSQPPGSPRE